MKKENFYLDEAEKEKCIESIVEYDNVWNTIDKIQMKLCEVEEYKENLVEEIRLLTDKIEKIKKEEAYLMKSLIEKYGQFKINFETFECEPII
jgi:uncharacterized protein (UPF0305 family)